MFGEGLPAYKFENICIQKKSIKLKDGAYKIFFNAAKYDNMGSDEEKAFALWSKLQSCRDFASQNSWVNNHF